MILTPEEQADFELLSLASEKGKFGLQLDYPANESEQMAFERGIDNEWFIFVDLARIEAKPGLFRIFKLREAGRFRLITLKNKHDRTTDISPGE